MELLHYVTESRKNVFREWLEGLPDARTRAKVAARVARLLADNFGDCKPLYEGVWELRIDWGPGYRIYYARIGAALLILLCGGDKRHQQHDIERAVTFLRDYKRRMEAP
jgi:putative addiction module killer protein